jgi:hypothetical protein
MPSYDGIRFEPLTIAETDFGQPPGFRTQALNIGAFRSYSFAPDLNAGNRPTSGQIYPRGVR